MEHVRMGRAAGGEVQASGALGLVRARIDEDVRTVHAHADDLNALADRIFGPQPQEVALPPGVKSGDFAARNVRPRSERRGHARGACEFGPAKARLLDLA